MTKLKQSSANIQILKKRLEVAESGPTTSASERALAE
jgi:hypothetical protein